MGTRSLTIVRDGGKEIVTIYQQSDGYPTGVGADLKAFAGSMQICNGIRDGYKAGEWANGMGCFAAQLIARLKKKDIGSVYIYPVGARNVGEEYVYTLSNRDGRLYLEVCHPSTVVWEGLLGDFDPEKLELALTSDDEEA